MHRIGLDQPQRGTDPDRLADGHSRLHPRVAGLRRHLPELASGIGDEERSRVTGQPIMTRLFTAQWEERDPNAGSERARRTSRHFSKSPKGTRIYPETSLCRKLPLNALIDWYI